MDVTYLFCFISDAYSDMTYFPGNKAVLKGIQPITYWIYLRLMGHV